MSGVDNLLYNKSYSFAIRVVNAYKFLTKEKNEYVLSKQLLRSGTAIGALIREAKFAQSTADFINKLSISLKEANETQYWIELLHDTGYIDDTTFKSIYNEVSELTALLVSIVKTTKLNSTTSKP